MLSLSNSIALKILFCFLDVAYDTCFSLVRKTCATEFEIKTERNKDADACKKLCNEDNDCKFAFINNAKECYTYKSCDETRSSLKIGTTYAKIGGCPG